MIAKGAISWKSTKQAFVASLTMAASSTMAAKFLHDHGLWLRNFFIGLQIINDVERSRKIFGDNEPSILYSNNNRSTIRTKFIDILFLIIKERAQDKVN